MKNDLKVLISPLDWGLGHATRCIPIIQYMLTLGWKVTLAAERETAGLLSKEFPDLPLLHIKGYRIRYPKKGWLFLPKIILQIPNIMYAIVYEHRWLHHNLNTYTWDVVVSDNRYGLFTKKAKTIIITHQLKLISGCGDPIDYWLQKKIYRRLSRFNACWVPDTADDMNISGTLSHTKELPQNVQFIGPVSRMKKENIASKNFILLLLSGPEPQRTLLEEILTEQATQIDEWFLCIRGLPNTMHIKTDLHNIHFKNHVNAVELSHYIQESKLVVCRTGYSTVMDLIKLQKKALMIPTPGQTEQEYLGKRLMQLNWFTIQPQKNLDLKQGIEKCLMSANKIPEIKFDEFCKAMDTFSIQYFGT